MLQLTKEMKHADSYGGHTKEMFEAILLDARNNGIGDRAVVLEDENKRPYVNWLGDDFEYCTDLVKRLEEMYKIGNNDVMAPPRVGEEYDCLDYCIGRYQTIKDKTQLGVMEHLDVMGTYTVTYISSKVVAVTSFFHPDNEVVLTVPEFLRCFKRVY